MLVLVSWANTLTNQCLPSGVTRCLSLLETKRNLMAFQMNSVISLTLTVFQKCKELNMTLHLDTLKILLQKIHYT